MPRSTPRIPLSRLRTALLLTLVGFVGVVVILYMIGRRPAADTAVDGTDNRSLADLLLSGEGFDYAVTEDGRKLFHIRAERIRSDKEDNFELENLHLSLDREDGTHYEVESTRGTFDRSRDEALLAGEVEVRGPEGLVLTTEALEVKRKGRLLVSNATVYFKLDDGVTGRARHLTVHLKRKLLVLSGQVRIERAEAGGETSVLTCGRASYDERDALLRAEEGVEVIRGPDSLLADRMSLTLDDVTGRARFLSANWNVDGTLIQGTPPEGDAEEEPRKLRFTGDELIALFDQAAGTIAHAELRGGTDDAAVRVPDEAGSTQILRAPEVLSDFQNGRLTTVQTRGATRLLQFEGPISGRPQRRLSGDAAAATFLRDGRVEGIVLTGNVGYLGEPLEAGGDRLVAGQDARVWELTGDRAWAMHPDGRIEAPRILYLEDQGQVRAVDGASATLDRGLGALPGGRSAEADPTRIEAREANWDSAARTVTFHESVRAWQGDNLLLADELSWQADSEVLTATGSIKTIWAQEDADGAAGSRPPLEVTSETLIYERLARRAKYSGEAHARQHRRSVRSQEIDVLLDETEKIERLIFTGTVRIDDPDAGRKVSGDIADYTPADAIVRLTGDPVILEDRDGGLIRGKAMDYDLESGTARVRSREDRLPEPAAAGTSP